MPHDSKLIATVVAGFVLAFAFGFIAKRLRISPIVGYLLAGIAVGPYTPGFVADAALSSQLAEIGVILLMFGVGLHFSIDDLLAMRRIALPGAIVQIAVATTIGTGVAVYWGWSLGAGLLFGLALSVASTVVLIRALEDRNLIRSVNGQIAVGWLVVEDFAMVVALVLLPPLTQALSGGATAGVGSLSIGTALAWTVGKVVVFIVLALVIGKRLVPWLLAHVARAGSRELFTLFVLAVALGIAYASSALFGVSFALGAFFAGVILSGTDLSYRAGAEMLPLQDAFAVLFFVSVGMLFNYWIVLSEPLSVLLVLLIIMLGKSIAAFAIVIAFRYPISVALTVSASLAQIGEFSFILAGLGTHLGVLPPEGRDLILAGALLSIALNPAAFQIVGPLDRWLHGRQSFMRWVGGESPKPQDAAIDGTDLSDHAVIVGYGRVGSIIGSALETQGMPFVIVERDRRIVDALTQRSLRVIYGDAAQPYVLKQTHIERARLLIIAAPDGLSMSHLHREARRLNPKLDSVVRTHSDDELVQFQNEGAGLAVMGERELALRMTEYSLLSLGLDEGRVRHVLQALRD